MPALNWSWWISRQRGAGHASESHLFSSKMNPNSIPFHPANDQYFSVFLCRQLPAKYPRAVFLKVDVDKCQDTAAAQGVSAMPTFVFYRNKAKIDRLQGADMAGLEHKIRQHIGSTEDGDAGGEEEEYGQGLMDLTSFIEKSGSECLNESDDHPFGHCLKSGGYLQSDCDEQLILAVTFNQVMKIHSIKFKAPATIGPKNIRLFINQPRTLDFDQAESSVSVQDLV